jgi:hypothetical protein
MPVDRTDARFGFEDFQVRPLRFNPTLPSLNVPVAVNLTSVPCAILAFAGFIAIETRCAVDTVSVVEPLTDPKSALIVVLPAATLVTTP